VSLFQNYNNSRNVCLKNLLGVLSGKKITVPTYVVTAISFFPPPLKYFIQHTFLHLLSYVSLIVKGSFSKIGVLEKPQLLIFIPVFIGQTLAKYFRLFGSAAEFQPFAPKGI